MDSIIPNTDMYNYIDDLLSVYVSVIKDDIDEKFLDVTSKSRKINIKKHKLISDRNLMLVGDIMAKKILPQDSKFSSFNNGKPYLINYSNIKFNKSHSGNIVVLSISNKDIGIDIQEHKSVKYKDIALKIFNKNELAELEKFNNNEKTFFDIWTKKESYLKMTGTGLTRKDINNMEYKNCEFYYNNDLKNYSLFICLSNK